MWMHFIDVNQVYDNINENLGYVSVEPKYVCVYENDWFFFLAVGNAGTYNRKLWYVHAFEICVLNYDNRWNVKCKHI